MLKINLVSNKARNRVFRVFQRLGWGAVSVEFATTVAKLPHALVPGAIEFLIVPFWMQDLGPSTAEWRANALRLAEAVDRGLACEACGVAHGLGGRRAVIQLINATLKTAGLPGRAYVSGRTF